MVCGPGAVIQTGSTAPIVRDALLGPSPWPIAASRRSSSAGKWNRGKGSCASIAAPPRPSMTFVIIAAPLRWLLSARAATAFVVQGSWVSDMQSEWLAMCGEGVGFQRRLCETCKGETLHYAHKCSVCGVMRTVPPRRPKMKRTAAIAMSAQRNRDRRAVAQKKAAASRAYFESESGNLPK